MNESNSRDASPLPSSERTHPLRRWSWTKLLLSLVIFASGAIVGTCTTLILIRQQVHHRIHHPEEMPGKLASRVQWKFDLSDDQTQQVEAILTVRQQAIQKIRREFQPQLERELDQLDEQIVELLEGPQQAHWQKWFQETRAKWLPAAP